MYSTDLITQRARHTLVRTASYWWKGCKQTSDFYMNTMGKQICQLASKTTITGGGKWIKYGQKTFNTESMIQNLLY